MKFPYIILMKVGPYCDFSLKEIINIKKKEEKLCGYFYWGYGGVFCRPNIIQAFIFQAKLHNLKPVLLFTETQSKYQTTSLGKFTKYSIDKIKWKRIQKEILLVGNQKKSHFAIVANNLKKVNFDLNLSDYCTNVGMFPDSNKRLDKYLKYRVDKACGTLMPDIKTPPKSIHINYQAELVDPSCIYIK